MNVEVTLFGFGDERPRAFGSHNHLELKISESTTISDTLKISGFKSTEGLSALLNNTLVQSANWGTTPVRDGDTLKILLAIEGG